MICPHADTVECYEIVRSVLQRTCHIDVNIGKLKAWSPAVQEPPEHVHQLGDEVWRGGDRPLSQQGLKVVGSPVVTPEYIVEFGREVIESEAQLLQQLPKLASLQIAWLLLYFCAVPVARINHLLRTVPPSLVRTIAEGHDTAVQDIFRSLFKIGDEASWDTQLHGVSLAACMEQASLPLRLAGCGLRNSVRTSSAAYWASWADSLGVICQRYPLVGQRILAEFVGFSAGTAANAVPNVLQEAELAGARCDQAVTVTVTPGRDPSVGSVFCRPSWEALAAGVRPPAPEPDELALGEWAHGWQFHASSALEKAAFRQLQPTLALPSRRSNAAATGKTRLQSACGRFSSAWLTGIPATKGLTFSDDDFLCLVRMRIGLAICIDGPDPHGYYRLADSYGGRTHARHKAVIAAWRQVFIEAGGDVPDQNVERMLRRTHVPVQQDSQLRMDLVVPGLNVAEGLPFFCDVTVLSPLTHYGRPRPGTSNAGGRLLERAHSENDSTYEAVTRSGLGSLQCLGFEVFGRWGKQSAELLPKLARGKARAMHPRLRKGAALAYQRRWAGLISIGLMKAVATSARRGEGADLATTLLEPLPCFADIAL